LRNPKRFGEFDQQCSALLPCNARSFDPHTAERLCTKFDCVLGSEENLSLHLAVGLETEDQIGVLSAYPSDVPELRYVIQNKEALPVWLITSSFKTVLLGLDPPGGCGDREHFQSR
jgi:hypothetical protein